MATKRDNKKTSTPTASSRGAAPQTPEPIIRRTRASDDPPNALVAAYEAGRLLNQLDWHLQQAWLLPAITWKEARQHATEVSDILSALARIVRPALAATAGIQLSESILAQRDRWDRDFGSIWHIGKIEGKSDYIRYELAQEVDCDLPAFLEDNWRVELYWVENFSTAISTSILAELDERGQRALELGLWVDRGVRPRAAYRYLCRETKPPAAEAAPPPVDNSCWLEVDGTAHPPNAFRDLPPVLYTIATETIVPEYGWLDQVRHCCRAMEFPISLFESLEALLQEARASVTEPRVARFVESLDELLRDELDDLNPQEKTPAEERTRPMTKQEAARLMKFGGDKKGVEQLTAGIKAGIIKCEQLTRQSHIFSKSDFPPEVRERLN
jgi:hypothetical protein